MARPEPFRLLHALRTEDVMRYSSRITLALAMLEKASPDPVPVAAFRIAFGSTPAEASHVLARMRSLGLVERGTVAADYRLSETAKAMRERIASMLAGDGITLHELPATQENQR